jgi:putative salt-induced outer membrane protein
MSRTHALALTILALSSLNAAAQDAGSSNDRFSGKAALGYISTSGNTDSTSANASLSLGWALTAWSHAFELSGIGASTDDQTTAEAYLFKYEARRAFGEHGYLFTALDYKRDRFSGYAEQVSQTVGYGRRLIDRDRHKLDAGVGFGARQSELRDGTEEDDAIVRGSVDYFWTLSDTTEFEQRLVIESGSTNTMTEADRRQRRAGAVLPDQAEQLRPGRGDERRPFHGDFARIRLLIGRGAGARLHRRPRAITILRLWSGPRPPIFRARSEHEDILGQAGERPPRLVYRRCGR